MASYSPFQTITGKTKTYGTVGPFSGPAAYAASRTPSPFTVGTSGYQTAGNAVKPPLAAGSAARSTLPVPGLPNPDGTPSTPAPPARPAAPTLDYSSDPVLAQIRLLGQESVPNAIADADAAKKALLVQYGDPNVARQAVFGGKGFNLPGIAGGADFTIADTTHAGDENTAAAAQKNPFSVLARLLHTHQGQQHSIDEDMNQQNLFYSGARSKALQEEERLYQQDQTDAYSQLAQALAGIDSGVGQAYQSEADRQMAAERDAYLRALAAAAQNPPGAGPGGGGDNSGGGTGDGGSGTTNVRTGYLAPALAAFSGPAAWANAMASRPTSAPLPNAYNRKTVARLR